MRAVSPPGKYEGAAVMPRIYNTSAMSQFYNTVRPAHAIIAEKSRRIPL